MHRVKPKSAKTGSEYGFIYFNALLDLVLVAAVMPLIVIFYMYSASYMEDLDAGKVEWRLFAAELQSYLAAAASIEIIKDGTGIRVTQAGTEYATKYDIEVYNSMIRKQKFDEGHEIMLTNIIKCNFSIEGQVLKITAIRSNGTEERSEYAITGP